MTLVAISYIYQSHTPLAEVLKAFRCERDKVEGGLLKERCERGLIVGGRASAVAPRPLRQLIVARQLHEYAAAFGSANVPLTKRRL